MSAAAHLIDEAAEAVARLRGVRRALVTSHRNPDGDALGSELAMAELLEALGAEVLILNRDPAPPTLTWLPGLEAVRVASELPADFPGGWDLAVTMECPGLDRTGFDTLDAAGELMNIDHHLANDRYGTLCWLDSSAPAVGEMVWRLFVAAEVEPSAGAATAMYTAIHTDTGGFAYPNTSAVALRAAADLVACGADPAMVAESLASGRSEASTRLLGEALRNLELHADGRLAVAAVDPEAFARAGADPSDTEDLINVPRGIAGVELVAFLKQWDPGRTRASLRSRGDLDVQAVAAGFGGGGHLNAAGCTIHHDLPEARAELVRRLVALLEA